MRMKVEGKDIEVKKVTLQCVGGCGKKMGPMFLEKGTQAEFECLPCRIKRCSI